MTALDDAFDAWVQEARAVTVREEVERRGIRLRRSGSELVGPCPVCGGDDRFSVSTRRNVFNCRKGGRGGDAIALVQYLDGADFLGACETLAGRPAPRGEGMRATPEELAAREEARRAKQDEHERIADHFREIERRRLFEMWCKAQRGAAPVTEYFAKRGIQLPPVTPFRFLAYAPYFHGQKQGEDGKSHHRLVHRGPAMLAPITDQDGRFRGLHFTWLDFRTPKGKAEIFDPDTGELLPAKKVRGAKQGNRILLVPAVGGVPQRQWVGEGIETVMSVYASLQHEGLGDAEFVSSVDLGNLAGGAADRVAHPTERKVDKLGRERPVFVASGEPDFTRGAMWVPDTVREMVLLGDGDSDPFTTQLAMARAEKRHAVGGRRVTTAWAPDGLDFNDVLMGRAA